MNNAESVWLKQAVNKPQYNVKTVDATAGAAATVTAITGLAAAAEGEAAAKRDEMHKK